MLGLSYRVLYLKGVKFFKTHKPVLKCPVVSFEVSQRIRNLKKKRHANWRVGHVSERVGARH